MKIELLQLKKGVGKMKIELYVKNRDMQLVAKYLEKFLAQHPKGKNKIELKRSTKIDILNHALSNENYRRIINFYIDTNLLGSALNEIATIIKKGIEIRIVFKYSCFGNTILINDNEIIDFIQKENEKLIEMTL